MVELQSEKFSDIFKDINWELAKKGVIYASLLMIGTLVGAYVRHIGMQGFRIWILVAAINVITTLVVFKYLREDLSGFLPKKKKKSKKEDKYMADSDK